MSSVTWQCPQCGRRVPNRVAECHCGLSRDQALAAPEKALSRGGTGLDAPVEVAPIPEVYRFSWRRVPRDVKLMVIGLVVVLLAGVGVLFAPWKTRPVVPLLGWSEPARGRPSPPPTLPRRNPRSSPSPRTVESP